MSILYFSLIYVIIAKSYQLTYISSGFFQLSHAIVITIGAYFVYWLCVQLFLNVYLSIIISLLISSLMGWGFDYFLYRPLRKLKKKNMDLMIASLGVFVVFQNVISLVWGDRILSFQNRFDDSIVILFDKIYISHTQAITIVICLFLLPLLWWFSEKTAIGVKIKTLSINPFMAEAFGVRKDKVIGWSYLVGSLYAAFIGILIAANYNIIPKMGFNWLFLSIVVLIIAGLGRMRYLMLSALMLATIQQLSAYFFDSKWMNATAYIILVVFLYFRPYGFSGKRIKKTEV